MPARGETRRAADRAGDILIAMVLAAACAAYLSAFPHTLGGADEGLILYEAKRLLKGDVFFRDLFEIIPPGSQYIVAAAFWLFGTTIVTARAVDTAVQTLIVVLVYACGRAAGARRPFAAVAACSSPVLLHPVWPYVSPHWMSTAVALGLLWVCLRRPWARHAGRAAAAGVLLGVMALVQHQRAVPFAAAVVALLCVDAVVGRRFGDATTMRTVAQRVGACAGAALLVAGVPFIALIAAAGIEPVFRGLVQFPIVNYHRANSARWGAVWLVTGRYAALTVPVLLRWAPLALGAAAAFGATWWWRRERLADIRAALALVILGAAQIAAVLYFPDLIHLAFLAPLCMVAVVVDLEWSVRALSHARAAVATAGVATVALALIAWDAHRVYTQTWGRITTSAPTAFGRIDFDDPRFAALFHNVARAHVDRPGDLLLCYPTCPGLHLLTDTRNPTPFQLILPGYSSADQIAAAVDAVERARAAIVVLFLEVPPTDPVRRVIADHYQPVPDAPGLWEVRDGPPSD